MAISSSEGLAGRVGRGVGSIVAFLLWDKRAAIRWLKWLIVGFVLAVVVMHVGREVAKASVTLLVLSGVILTISRLGGSSSGSGEADPDVPFHVPEIIEKEGYQDGLMGYGYYIDGTRIDMDDHIN